MQAKPMQTYVHNVEVYQLDTKTTIAAMDGMDLMQRPSNSGPKYAANLGTLRWNGNGKY